MALKGIFCLEGLWEADLRRPSTVEPIHIVLKYGRIQKCMI